MSKLSEQDCLTLLLKAYRGYPCLWDSTNPQYMNRDIKQTAYEALLNIYKKSRPDANMEKLKKKLDNMRGSYRRERKKVEVSKGGTDVYVSKLWFYDLLSFLDERDAVGDGTECGLHNDEESDEEIAEVPNLDMDEEALISLVAGYKELYDLQNPYYVNMRWKNRIWNEIGGILQIPAQQCRERWKRIRDNYRRAKKLRITKSEQGVKTMRNPKYDKILSFLTPYMEYDTESDTNLTPNDPPVVEDECHSNSSAPASNSSIQDSMSFALRGASFPQLSEESKQYIAPYSTCKTSVTDYPDQDSPTSALPKQHLEEKTGSTKHARPIVDFFTNLGESVAEFPELIQIQVKRKVFGIVSEAEEQVCNMKRLKDATP